MSEELYTLIGVCELWGCIPLDVMFMARHGDKKDAYWQHIKTLEFVKAVVDDSEITTIDISDNTIAMAEYAYTCNNCGADSLKGCEFIKHHKGCKPGEAAYWAKHYSECVECKRTLTKEDIEFWNRPEANGDEYGVCKVCWARDWLKKSPAAP